MAKARIDQEAHLRIVLHDQGKHQLLFFADLKNFDLYAGPAGVRNKLRSTWHKTGQVHLHSPAGRQIGPPRAMPEHFEGRSKLYSGGYVGDDWTYQLKPDSPTRRTLVIDKHSVERGLSCDLWAAEKGGDDLVEQILAEYDGSSSIELVSYIMIAWTQPQLVGVVGTLTLASSASWMHTRNRGSNYSDKP